MVSLIHVFSLVIVLTFSSMILSATSMMTMHKETIPNNYQNIEFSTLNSFNYTYFAQYGILEENNECGKQRPCSMQNLLQVASVQIESDIKNYNFSEYVRFEITIVLMNNFTANDSNCELSFKEDFGDDVVVNLNFQSLRVDRMNSYACTNRQTRLIASSNLIGLENVEMQNLQGSFYKILNSKVTNCIVNPIGALNVSNSILNDVIIYPPFSVFIGNSQLIHVGFSISVVDLVEITNSSILVGAHDKFELNNVQLFKITNVQFMIDLEWKMSLRSIQEFNFIDSVINYVNQVLSSDSFIFDLDTVFKVKLSGLRVQNIGEHAFNIQYSSFVSFRNLEVVGNRCRFKHSLIQINHASEVNFININFKDNSCTAISIENVRTFFCDSSTFINNGRNTNGGAISGTDIRTLSITNTTFIGNKAIGGYGGGSYFQNIGLGIINKCHWENNTASIQGGGLVYYGDIQTNNGLIIIESKFIGNSLDSISNNTISENFEDCKGSGGAFSVFPLNALSSCHISGNRATWGGGGFYFNSNPISFDVENTVVTDNIALFAGGGLFSKSLLAPQFNDTITMQGNQAFVYGDNVASPIHNILDFEVVLYDIEGQSSNTLRNPKTIKIFYGQKIAVKFLRMVDLMGNEFTTMQEIVGILDFFYKFEIKKHSIPNGIELEIRKTNDNMIHTNDTIVLGLLIASLPLNLQFEDCPSGYELGEKVCVKSFPTDMVASLSVFGFFIVLIVGGIIGFLFSKIVKKLSYLRERVSILAKREQADEDIERKLLESPFQSYGEQINTTRDSISLSADFSITNTPRTKLKKISKFIINSEDLTFTKKVAEGGFGSVYLAKWNSSMDVAVKSFHQNSENTDEEEFEKEVALLVNLRNPHIVSFYGVCITESKKFMVVEYMDKGSLDRIIYESRCGRETISFKRKLRILIEVASGMKYLHGLNPVIIHRDLKPANILINSTGSAKVCDFGLSKTVNSGSRHSLYTATVGTLYYIAPEMINSDMKKQSNLLHKIDVYSFAIVAWELFFEESPFLNEESRKIHYFSPPLESEKVNAFSIIFKVSNNGLRPKIPFTNRSELSEWMNSFMRDSDKDYFTHDGPNEKLIKSVEFYIELMRQSWDQEPSNRPNFAQILTQLLTINELLEKSSSN